MDNHLISQKELEQRIYTVRDKQVMLDSDLASIYQVATKVFNQAIRRNAERFPESFCFQLSAEEWEVLRSQIVTLDTGRGQHRKYLPYGFTEQGVAMLSAVLRSEVAVRVSIDIMNAFVELRKNTLGQAALFHRLDRVELKQLEADLEFEKIFKAMESGRLTAEKGIFYDGQVFDAYSFVSGIIRSATRSIILIDNYVDDTVLTLLGKRKDQVHATIYTRTISPGLQLDLNRYNSQYAPIQAVPFAHAHDRFLLLDSRELYHIGASLKDLGKKWFAFSKMDKEVGRMLQFLNNI